MRILHITAQKPDSTGSGVYLHQLVSSLCVRGIEQAVLCGIDDGDPVDLPAGVRSFPVVFNTPQLPFHLCGMSDEMPYPSTRYRDLTPAMLEAWQAAYRQRLREALDAFDPDVVVCNHLYLLTALAVEELQAHPQRIPVLGICHNTCLRQLSQHGLERERIMAAIPQLSRVLALHSAQAAQISELFGIPRERIAIIGTAYDSHAFRPLGVSPSMEGEPHGEPRIELCYAGKISYKKGVHSLLAALNLLPCRPGVVRLRLCGGVSNSFQKTAIELLMRENRQDVRLLCRVSLEELVGVMQTSQVFVLPSFYEGLPLVVVEEKLPGAPVWYVPLPRMTDVDEPLKRDLPAFEQRLADAIREAVLAPPKTVDCSHLTWDALAARLLGFIAAL